MDTSYTIVIANLLLIGALPRIFFRRDGRMGPMWWVTGAPFFTTGGALVAAALGTLTPVPLGIPVPVWLAASAASLLSAISIGLIGFTLGTHRIPLALWHQRNDAPVKIVTWGAYRRVRHPFYAAFLLTQVAGVLAVPHPITIAALTYAIAILSYTARREERRLLDSELGSEYRDYMKGTGRFLPGFGRALAQ